MSEITLIRSQFRVALPEDDGYIYKLGVAIYSFASVNSFLCEIISTINPEEYNHTSLQDKTSGQILETFKVITDRVKAENRLQSIHEVLDNVAGLFELLNNRRNDIFHAYPITGSSGAQILHRRKDAAGKYFEITEELLDKFIHNTEKLSRLLYQIREATERENVI